MFPIKLLETEWVNPEAVLHVDFIPKNQSASQAAVFNLSFQNTDFYPLQYRGADAEEAFDNWKEAYAREASAPCCNRGSNDQKKNS